MIARLLRGRDQVPSMATEVIRDWPRLRPLAAEWNALLSRSRADSLFLRWEWIEAWADVIGQEMPLVVVVARDADGDLAGVAPYYTTDASFLRLLPFRVLRTLGDHPTGAEYPDWVVRVDRERDAVEAMARTLATTAGWDCIWMPNASGWTGALERARHASGAGRFLSHVRTCDFAAVELPARMQDYVESLSQNKRQQLRQETRRIASRPGVSIVQCTEVADVPIFLDALFDLHGRRWAELGQVGTFGRKPAEARFYRRFAPVALERGWLRLFALQEAGSFKAVQIGYVYNNIFHQLQEGFDPRYLKGAGNVLRANVIERCIAEGVKTIDFLGEMTEHKRRWQAAVRSGQDVFMARRCVRTRLLFAGQVWPTGRYLRPTGSPRQ
jgi:CelD/BcsL family acetyltransferase involved in cellulose biosynthesis